MGNGFVYAVHHLDGKDIVQKLGVKVRRASGRTGNDGGGACVQPQLYRQLARSNAVGAKTLRELWQKLLRNGRVHQTHLLGVAHAGAAGLGVFNNVQCLGLIGGIVHKNVADAGTGLDAGHLGILHAGADQPCTAPGDQQIHIAHGSHQGVGGSVGGVLNQADRIFRQTVLPQPLPQCLHNGVGAAPGLLAAAQDAGVAALDGKGGGIAGHVGTALVDDGDHAHGHSGLFDHQPVGALHPLQYPAHRVGQGSNLFNALCHGADALLGQGKTIQHHLADMSLCSGHIVGVGGKDSHHVCRAAQLRSHTA